MSILESMDLENLPEERPLPEGEYETMITGAEEYVGKTSGKMSIRVILTVPGEVDAQDIFHYLSLPQEVDDPKTVNRKKRRIRDFLMAFDLLPTTPYAEWFGHKSWALIKQEPDQNGEMRNSVVRFLGRSDNSNIQATSTEIPF